MKKVLLYTIHKSGSMFLHQFLGTLAKEYKLDHFSMNYETLFEPIKQRSWVEYIDQNQGIFGPIRILEAEPNIPEDLSEYSVILHTRDPRDVLTSLYYSHTYSHKTWEGGFNPSAEKRSKWEEKGIDRFVSNHKVIKKKYQVILDKLLGKPGVIHVRYEEMVNDYASWLSKVLTGFTHLPFPDQKFLHSLTGSPTIEKLHSKLYHKFKNEFSTKKEDIYSNKRQITPGDHRRKLKPESIDSLNQSFSEILAALNYDVRET